MLIKRLQPNLTDRYNKRPFNNMYMFGFSKTNLLFKKPHFFYIEEYIFKMFKIMKAY